MPQLARATDHLARARRFVPVHFPTFDFCESLSEKPLRFPFRSNANACTFGLEKRSRRTKALSARNNFPLSLGRCITRSARGHITRQPTGPIMPCVCVCAAVRENGSFPRESRARPARARLANGKWRFRIARVMKACV